MQTYPLELCDDERLIQVGEAAAAVGRAPYAAVPDQIEGLLVGRIEDDLVRVLMQRGRRAQALPVRPVIAGLPQLRPSGIYDGCISGIGLQTEIKCSLPGAVLGHD